MTKTDVVNKFCNTIDNDYVLVCLRCIFLA